MPFEKLLRVASKSSQPRKQPTKPNFLAQRTGFPLQTERDWWGLVERTRRYWDLPRRLNAHCGHSVVTARTPSPTERRIPIKLTDTQLVLLSAASQREDGAVVLAPSLKGGAAGKVIGKLLRDGLVEEVPAGASMPVWRRDDDAGPRALRISK